MYEGSDSHSNMALVLPNFFEAVERIQNEEFSLIGHKVKVFLEGDYLFLDDCFAFKVQQPPAQVLKIWLL